MLVGLVGKAKAGKDTVADFLVKKGYLFYSIAFADGLKEICSTLFNIPLNYFYQQERKEKIIPRLGMTLRDLMQKVGSGMRNVYPHVWSEYLRSTILRLQDSEDLYAQNIIVTDVRMIEEAEMIKSLGGHIIRVVKVGGATLSGAQAEHISETEQDSPEMEAFVDYTITAQAGDVEGLCHQAEQVIGEILCQKN